MSPIKITFIFSFIWLLASCSSLFSNAVGSEFTKKHQDFCWENPQFRQMIFEIDGRESYHILYY